MVLVLNQRYPLRQRLDQGANDDLESDAALYCTIQTQMLQIAPELQLLQQTVNLLANNKRRDKFSCA